MSVDKVMLEAQRGLDRLDAFKARLDALGLGDRQHLLASHSMMLGYLAGALSDEAWADAEEAAVRYLEEQARD